jgi:hypothetical protein
LKILNTLAKVITTMRLCDYDMHGTTSRSWLVESQELHIHVHCDGDLAILKTALFTNTPETLL